MNKPFVRRFAAALLLCVMAIGAFFPLRTLAYSDAFTTVTYIKDKDEYSRLVFPAKRALYTEKGKLPRRAEVKASWKDGCIYFMPRAELGHGTLGVVETGTPVTILANQNNLYFFMTDDGRMGWNGGTFFTKPVAIDKDLDQPLGEDSPLTGQDAVTISDYIRDHKNGCAPNAVFYADRPVVVIKSGEKATITLHGQYSKAKYSFKCLEGSSADAEWLGEKFVRGRREVEFTAREKGASVFRFTNNRNKVRVDVLVIVV